MSNNDQIIKLNGTLTELPWLGDVVMAIGVFDGMHVGHRTLFADAREYAAKHSLPLIAVTFDRDPDEVFRADDPLFGKLLSNEDRLDMVCDQVDGNVVVLPATAAVFSLSPEEFLQLLEEISHPQAIFTGANFHFGAHAQGTGEDIEKWAASLDRTYVCCELVELDGGVVSSTRIRGLLDEGKVAEAKHLLAGRPHSVSGPVVRGRGEGTGFGFATANLDLVANEVMLPREGVYGAYCTIDGTRYAAAVNVGAAKSFADATATLEAHVLDFEGDLYGAELEVEFEHWLREPRVFESKEELIFTVMGNIDWVRRNMGGE